MKLQDELRGAYSTIFARSLAKKAAAELDLLEAREKALVECLRQVLDAEKVGPLSDETLNRARALLDGK